MPERSAKFAKKWHVDLFLLSDGNDDSSCLRLTKGFASEPRNVLFGKERFFLFQHFGNDRLQLFIALLGNDHYDEKMIR